MNNIPSIESRRPSKRKYERLASEDRQSCKECPKDQKLMGRPRMSDEEKAEALRKRQEMWGAKQRRIPIPKVKSKIIQVRQIELINFRFNWAFTTLVKSGSIKSLYQFAKDYGLNGKNFSHLIRKPGSVIPALYLDFLILDYGINPFWLHTGDGHMFTVQYSEGIESITGI